MRRNDSGDVLDDAVEAVTLDRDVEWDRCARLADPAERPALDALRSLAPFFRVGDGDAGRAAPFAGGLARRAGQVVMVLAAVEVASTLLLLPWRWSDYHRAYGDLAVYMALLLAGHAASAGLLLLAGRRDRRTWLLGAYFLFKAAIAPSHMLPAFWGQLPPADLAQPSVWDLSAPTQAFLLVFAYPLAFAISPVFLWAFAGEYPRVRRRTTFDDCARRMVPLSAAIGCAMCAALAAVYLAGAVGVAVGGAVYIAVLDATIATPNVLAVAAVVVVALRANAAPAGERRRVVVFSAGFMMWMGIATVYDLVEALAPGSWVGNYESGSAPALIQPLRFPGMVLLWYSVLAGRVPHPREVIHAGCRRVLLRPGLLGLAVAALAAATGWLLASRPERAVGEIVADPLTLSLFATGGTLLLVVLGRERLLRQLDAWIYPETVGQRQLLATAVATLASVERMSSIRRTVTRAVRRGCGSPSTLLAAAETHDFRAPDAAVAPLPRTSAIVHLLETGGGSLRVHPSDGKSCFDLLPPEEAAWVEESAADVIAPVPGPGAEVAGVLVVGRRFDDRIVRDVDVPFLEVLAGVAGQAAARLRLLRGTEARRSEAPPALECPVCGCVTGADESPVCGCGPAYEEAEGPRLLAGKFRLARRLGAGGAGSVYLARDVRLDRDVAVKTLAGTSLLRLRGLKREAWAMARVAHPAVAQIHGVEFWRGRPFLVMELLLGGTLSDRLREGPLAAGRAVAVTLDLADALAALHRAGYVHGDVKPSNIGLTADGSPKLLDFGLARGARDATVAGGTLRYLSPEVLDGRPAGEADDVWSLCVVLSETVSGEHPFAGGDDGAVADRIRHRRLRPGLPPARSSEDQSAVAAFAASVLTAPRPARPATARAFADALMDASPTVRGPGLR